MNMKTKGFTLVEITIGIALIGLVLLLFTGMVNILQSSSSRVTQYSDAQQNGRVALDYITEHLRAAGSDVVAWEGQQTILHAGPYQVAFNADLDQGQVSAGEQPLTAIDVASSPNTVAAGSHTPDQTYDSDAESIVLTLDSNLDGIVTSFDGDDESEEDVANQHLYTLKRHVYGNTAGNNVVRSTSVSLIRGPVAYKDGSNPPPLFEYYYNDDGDLTTPDLLWGDADSDGKLSDSEIAALTDMPDNLLFGVRKVKVNVVAEGLRRDKNNKSNGNNEGFAEVRMSSQVYIRNVDIHESAMVFGTVYYDANSNGKQDDAEKGISKVRVTCGNRKTNTDGFGHYSIPMSPGDYDVVETDPANYTSSTPNTVSISLIPGQKVQVDFGDDAPYDFGYIVGRVYEDQNQNKIPDLNEPSLSGVVVQLSNEMADETDENGRFRIAAPLGAYDVTEIDPTGYGSTTPNKVTVALGAQGDSVTVDFGDLKGAQLGTLMGFVFIDDDEDGVRDFGEKGIPDVELSLSNGAETMTDISGYYEFVVEPGKYDIYELDPDGYTSSSPNLIEDVTIAPDTTVAIDFGDILITDIDFIEIVVGDTDRPLSVSATDLKEDNNGDVDIVLGTPSGGAAGNVFIYENNYKDATTSLSDLFQSSPTHTRSAGTDVNAILTYDFNRDGYPDLATGQEIESYPNVYFWYNNHQQNTIFGNTYDLSAYGGYGGVASTMEMADIWVDGYIDIIVGNRSLYTPFTGGFTTLYGYYDTYTGEMQYFPVQIETATLDGTLLGEVTATDLGDIDLDGDLDLVVASNSGGYWGNIDIYLNAGNGWFDWSQRYLAKAGINDVEVVETYNDGSGLPDILAGVSIAQNIGGVQVWFNHGSHFGGVDSTGFKYPDNTIPKAPDDFINTRGEALAVRTAQLDKGIFPEILIGTKSSLFYTGDLFLIRMSGGAWTAENVKINLAGEVVTIDFADFNRDGALDIVATTRTSQTSGKLAVYFLDQGSLIP